MDIDGGYIKKDQTILMISFEFNVFMFGGFMFLDTDWLKDLHSDI